jgi:16S rRNA (cytidine1402-2'-O)-methyltransferase
MTEISKIKKNKNYTLTIVGTPIGNSMDLSPRGIEAFEKADIILCEDTRVTRKLSKIRNFRIQKLISFNEYNEGKKINLILDKIYCGKKVVLSSDAGMPLISDPGYKLVTACVDNGIIVDVVPGPSSIITALVSSGLSPANFYFAGFPPRKKNDRLLKIKKLLNLETTIIWFESPRRVVVFLEELIQVFGNRKAVVARELTKVYQEVLRDNLCSLVVELKLREQIKGEFIILLENFKPSHEKKIDDVTKKEIKKLLEFETLKSVVTKISSETDYPKNIIYNEALKIKGEK